MTSYSPLVPSPTTPPHHQWLLSATQIKISVLSCLRRCHMPRTHSPLQSPPEPGSSSSARPQHLCLPLSKSNTSPYSKGQFLPSLRVNGISAGRPSLAFTVKYPSLLLFSFTTPQSFTLWCLVTVLFHWNALTVLPRPALNSTCLPQSPRCLGLQICTAEPMLMEGAEDDSTMLIKALPCSRV